MGYGQVSVTAGYNGWAAGLCGWGWAFGEEVGAVVCGGSASVARELLYAYVGAQWKWIILLRELVPRLKTRDS